MSHSWDNLPTEVCLRIFEHLTTGDYSSSERWYVPKYNVLPCLLVCKNWCKPASILLYRNVEIGRQGLEFLKVITNSLTFTGNSVKQLFVCSDFVLTANEYHPIQLFTLILRQCPQLEHIRLSPAIQDLLGPYVMEASQYLKRLKSLDASARTSLIPNYDYDWNFMTRGPLYFKNSLEHLNLRRISCSGPTTNEQISLRYLISQLSQFTSLTQLDIADSKTLSLRLFDNILDHCKHLKQLNLFQVRFMNSDFGEQLIQPNYTIKSITGIITVFSPMAYSYFAKKFQGLQRLNVDCGTNSLNAADTYRWDAFTKYLCQLESYKIRMDPKEFKSWVLVYSKQLSLIKCLKPKERSFTIGFHSEAVDIGYGLELSYANKADKIAINLCLDANSNHYENKVLDALDSVSDILSCYPTRDVCLRDFRYMFDYVAELDPNDDLQKIIQFDNPKFTTLDWNVFDRIRLENKYTDAINLTLSDLILRCEPPKITAESFTSDGYVGNLCIENSIIHEDLFPEISRYSEIYTLKIFACSIIGGKDPFRMTINLPHSFLSLLEINCSLEFINGEHFALNYSEEMFLTHAQRFNNIDLRNALCGGRLMVSVEQKRHHTRWFLKDKGSKVLIPSNESAFNKFTCDDHNNCFLLAIKCEHLSELYLQIFDEDTRKVRRYFTEILV
jgi:hypothetical protein